MMKCVICSRRPATENGYCHNCAAKIGKECNSRQRSKPAFYLTYHGGVVGLFRNGDGKLGGKRLNISPDKLPKSNTINLNHYCLGYDRSQIKAFKRAVYTLCGI